jgi:nucleotide-binding universal stress UspA family protein
MLPFKQILCPVDFSGLSALALRYAELMAGRSGGLVTAVHATTFEAPAYFSQSRLQELERQFHEAQEEAHQALEKFANGNRGVQTLVVDARPVAAILWTAERVGADLIVMGTHGRSGFERYRMGSVAERILHESTVPVLTVRETPGREEPAIRKVLCPVNDSAAARKALDLAAEVASAFGAALVVAHVEEEGAQKREELCRTVPDEVRGKCQVEEILRQGNPAEEIVRLAGEQNADLLVMGAQHKAFADTTVIGTTTARAVRHAPCPVLTIIQQAR